MDELCADHIDYAQNIRIFVLISTVIPAIGAALLVAAAVRGNDRIPGRTKLQIALSAVACVLVVLCVRNFIRARSTTARQACIHNLQQIDAFKKQWDSEQAERRNTLLTNGSSASDNP